MWRCGMWHVAMCVAMWRCGDVAMWRCGDVACGMWHVACGTSVARRLLETTRGLLSEPSASHLPGDLLERTTGFEPATLTLAKVWGNVQVDGVTFGSLSPVQRTIRRVHTVSRCRRPVYYAPAA